MTCRSRSGLLYSAQRLPASFSCNLLNPPAKLQDLRQLFVQYFSALWNRHPAMNFESLSSSPQIRRLSTASSSSKREEDLINAYEAEEERIINILSRKLEQVRK